MRESKKWLIACFTGVFMTAATVTAYGAGWIWEDGYWWYQNMDGSYACNGSQVIDGVLYAFDENGHMKENHPQSSQTSEQEQKIQHIREVYNSINARNDLEIFTGESHLDYADQGKLMRTIFMKDFYLTLSVVDCYYENDKLIFAYGIDGVKEYRYYFENGNLIREIGPDGNIIDYPDGKGLERTSDPKAGEICDRGNWEVALFAEDYYGTGD